MSPPKGDEPPERNAGNMRPADAFARRSMRAGFSAAKCTAGVASLIDGLLKIW